MTRDQMLAHLRSADAVAREAAAHGHHPFGSVLVGPDDRVLGACALLLAGILGNMTDRARFGYVIDFIVVHAGSYHWPTFNIADASITLGAMLLAFDLVVGHRREESKT